MIALAVVAVVVLVVVRWRLAHHARRRSEAEARQVTHRPLGEFDARFPADRLQRSSFGRRARRRRGF
jgi:hypothetical protein